MSPVIADHAIETEFQEPPPKEEKKEAPPKTPEEFLTRESGQAGYKEILNVIEQTNIQRRNNGLAPLAINYKLMYAAREQAMAMAKVNILDHSVDGTTMGQRIRKEGYIFTAAAENIAWNNTASQVVGDWMNSPGHRSNILGPYKDIGVYRAYNQKGEPYWAQVFGSN